MKIRITPSSLKDIVFCEHSWALTAKAQAKRIGKPNKLMQLGLKKHKYLDEVFLSQTKRRVLFSDFVRTIKRTRTRIEPSKVMLFYENDEFLLRGKPDELISDITGIYVIDDKPGVTAHESYKMQVRAYCFLLKKMFPNEIGHKSIYGMLRSHYNGQIFWREKFEEKHEHQILNLIERVIQLKNGAEPEPTKDDGKCYKCFHSNYCKFKEKL